MKVIWNIIPLNAPEIERNCGGCGVKRLYRTSEKFRINAQGRNLDIWLIYKCIHCNHTWNMTVHERIRPESITDEEYRLYTENDINKVFECAFNKSVIQKNKACARYDDIRYEIKGDAVNPESGAFEITVETGFDMEIKLSKVICEKLCISGSALKRYAEQGRIAVQGEADLRKTKIKNGMKIIIK